MADSMAKRYLISAVALVFAGLMFFGERFAVENRLADLAAKRLEALQSDLDRLDRNAEERIRAGEYFRFLGIRPGAPTDQTELNISAEFIETALILDKAFVTLARSGRDLESAERAAIRERRQRGVLTEKSLLRRYDVVDFEKKRVGYLVYVLRPDLRASSAGAGLVVTNYNLSVITDFSRDRFNQDEKLLVAALLPKQAAAHEVFVVRGISYLSTRYSWLAENLILFQIAPLPPFYTFISPYFFIVVLAGVMAWIIHGHAAARHTRREVSERVLASYSRAVSEREAALNDLSRLATNETEISEKLIEPVSQEADIEARLAAARAAERARAEKKRPPVVVEVTHEERQFRFMNPAVSPRPAVQRQKLDEREQKIRQRAFSDELKGLMAAVSAPAVETARPAVAPDDLLRRISAFEEKYRYPAIDQYLYFLNELYFDEVTSAELAEAMRVAGDAVQSGSFAILLYDSGLAAYRTGFVHGVPDQLAQTFYLLPRDSVLANEFTDYGYVEFNSMLRKNPFFTKRFPAGFTDPYKGMHIFALGESFLKARIVFFDSDRGGAVSDEGTIRTVKSYLRQIAPAIHMFFIESTQSKGNVRDLADWAVHELKECVSLAEELPPFISQYVFEASLAVDAQLHLLKEISHFLREGEKVLMLSPSRVVAVHAPQSGKAIEEVIARQGKKYIVKESEFGKASRNLYTFIEF